MAEHKTQGAFLKALMHHADTTEGHELRARLSNSERDGKSIRRALFGMLVLLLLSFSALAYCIILKPELLDLSPPILYHGLLVLALASSICLIAYLLYLVSHRQAVDRLHVDCRRLVLLSNRKERPSETVSSER